MPVNGRIVMRTSVVACLGGVASGMLVFVGAYEVLWWLLVPHPLAGTPGVVLAVIPAVVYSLLIAAVGALLVAVYLLKRLRRSRALHP
jgi:hypothetical protein